MELFYAKLESGRAKIPKDKLAASEPYFKELEERKAKGAKGSSCVVVRKIPQIEARYLVEETMTDYWNGNDRSYTSFERNVVDRTTGDVLLSTKSFTISWVIPIYPMISDHRSKSCGENIWDLKDILVPKAAVH